MKRIIFSQLPIATLYRGRDYAVFSHQSFTENFVYPFLLEVYADYGDYKLAKTEIGIDRALYGLQKGFGRTVVYDVYRRVVRVIK